jgi:DNA-binding MarR family transcriptional regulator
MDKALRSAVTDPRITATDFRVLAMIVMRTDASGWCCVRQHEMAEGIGITRETVNKSIRWLSDCDYVERQLVNGPPASKRLRVHDGLRVAA